MKPHRQKKLGIILFITACLSIAVGLIFTVLGENMNMFYSPSDVAAGKADMGREVRVGGMVKEGSFVEDQASLKVQFVATDHVNDIAIRYEGMLPDLFREGQGVIAEGQFDDAGIFQASKVIAKHDENYMSPEVKAAMDAAKATGLAQQ